jgi:hypothetical protein
MTNIILFVDSIMGTGQKTRRKWSMKYKKSIDCSHPKGFSQKQHCKYGRKHKKRNTKKNKARIHIQASKK